MVAGRFYVGTVAVLICWVGVLGCTEKDAAPTVDEAQVEEQSRIEQEESRRQEHVAGLTERAAALRAAIGGARGQAEQGESGLPAKLDEALGEARARLAEAESALAKLGETSGDAWEAARTRADEALSRLDSAWQQASTALSDWERRETEALAASVEGSARYDASTGLIRGFDGSHYPPYRPATVRRVQEGLRRAGLYAGPVHGHLDQGTMDAIAQFQKAEGLGASGVPSPRTRHYLFEHPHSN